MARGRAGEGLGGDTPRPQAKLGLQPGLLGPVDLAAQRRVQPPPVLSAHQPAVGHVFDPAIGHRTVLTAHKPALRHRRRPAAGSWPGSSSCRSQTRTFRGQAWRSPNARRGGCSRGADRSGGGPDGPPEAAPRPARRLPRGRRSDAWARPPLGHGCGRSSSRPPRDRTRASSPRQRWQRRTRGPRPWARAARRGPVAAALEASTSPRSPSPGAGVAGRVGNDLASPPALPVAAFTPKFAALLLGDGDAAVHRPVDTRTTFLWDYAAAAMLLVEAGGQFTTWSGLDFLSELPDQYTGGWLASTSRALHRELSATLEQSLRTQNL